MHVPYTWLFVTKILLKYSGTTKTPLWRPVLSSFRVAGVVFSSFAWSYFVFSHGVFSSFRMAFFSSFHMASRRREKTKWNNPATILSLYFSKLIIDTCTRFFKLLIPSFILNLTKKYFLFVFKTKSETFLWKKSFSLHKWTLSMS